MISTDHKAVVTGPERPAGAVAPRRRRVSGKVIFFTVLLVVLLAYTQMAFAMQWVTTAGRIGPGFFPRIIGGLGVLVTLWAIWHSWRHPGDEAGVDEEEVGEGDLGRHPMAMLTVIGASLVLLLTLVSLGAIVASAVFMLAVLSYLNPRRWLVNVALSIAVPLALYLLFQTALNSGLPSGILPRF
jgi:hypothetical protein